MQRINKSNMQRTLLPGENIIKESCSEGDTHSRECFTWSGRFMSSEVEAVWAYNSAKDTLFSLFLLKIGMPDCSKVVNLITLSGKKCWVLPLDIELVTWPIISFPHCVLHRFVSLIHIQNSSARGLHTSHPAARKVPIKEHLLQRQCSWIATCQLNMWKIGMAHGFRWLANGQWRSFSPLSCWVWRGRPDAMQWNSEVEVQSPGKF